jgi:hypothetical protein
MTRFRLSARLLTLALALSTCGCGKLREVSACRSIAREVNGALDEIEALSKKTPLDEARIAKRYGALAQALGPRAVGEAPLAVAVREYVAVLRATELSLKNHADATKDGRPHDPRRELEKLGKRERAAVVHIDTECHD